MNEIIIFDFPFSGIVLDLSDCKKIKLKKNNDDVCVFVKTFNDVFVCYNEQEHMGLTTWENAPDGKIVKTDVSIAKNYLKEMELADMGQLVNGVLELAERMAKRHIPMTMEDWAKRIDSYLSSDERPLLDNAGSVSHEDAVQHAETEFEKYRIVQDRFFQSDFDKYLGALPLEGETKE